MPFGPALEPLPISARDRQPPLCIQGNFGNSSKHIRAPRPIYSHFLPLLNTIGISGYNCQPEKLNIFLFASSLGSLWLFTGGCKRPFIRRLGWVFRVLIQDYAVIGGSRPVSRVLSRTAIHLGCVSPRTSSDLPGDSCGHTNTPPYSVLLRVGFTLPQASPPARCALTAPFHPYRP